MYAEILLGELMLKVEGLSSFFVLTVEYIICIIV